MPTTTILLRDNFNTPALPGWNVLDNGATTWPAEPGIDAGPPQFGTWETETNWRKNLSTGTDGLTITMTKNGGQWEGGRLFYEGSFKPAKGQLMNVEFAATLPLNTGGRYTGYWPAGWMMPSVHRTARGFWPFAFEIDILEAIGGKAGSSQAQHMGHYGDNLYVSPVNGAAGWNEPTGIGTGVSGIDPWDNARHVYKFVWDRTLGEGYDQMRYYVDGTIRLTIKQEWFKKLDWEAGVFHDGFYPIFNLSIDGSFPQALSSTSTGATIPGGTFKVHYLQIDTVGDPIVPSTGTSGGTGGTPTGIVTPANSDVAVNMVNGAPVVTTLKNRPEVVGILAMAFEQQSRPTS